MNIFYMHSSQNRSDEKMKNSYPQVHQVQHVQQVRKGHPALRSCTLSPALRSQLRVEDQRRGMAVRSRILSFVTDKVSATNERPPVLLPTVNC